MTDKKLTDSEIVKALECCLGISPSTCKNCPLFNATNSTMVCSKVATKFALDLINRQKAEIERLNNCVKSEYEVREIAKRTMEPLVREIAREQIDTAVKLAKAEAYKECVEKIQNQIKNNNAISAEWLREYLYNLLKESVGEDK